MSIVNELWAQIESSIHHCIQLLEQHTEDQKLIGSSWSLHQHLEHLGITGRSTPILILDALEHKSDLSLNPNGQKLFELKSFPLGQTQAPDFAIPKGVQPKKILQAFKRLEKGIEDLKEKGEDIEHSDGRSEHPLLGGLTAFQWVTFLNMHFKHHLSIIKNGLKEN
jgi:hypothetical protein